MNKNNSYKSCFQVNCDISKLIVVFPSEPLPCRSNNWFIFFDSQKGVKYDEEDFVIMKTPHNEEYKCYLPQDQGRALEIVTAYV